MRFTCRGFRSGAVHVGLKADGALDLALIAADRPATAAAVFTSNKVKAAPVRVSRASMRRSSGRVSAVIVNSGNANACTGPRGMKDAKRMVAESADALGVDRGDVLVASTGVIGVPLPMQLIEPGIATLARKLRVGGFERFADGILTTDKRRKLAKRQVVIGGKSATLIGCTKGAGMIAPNMATTLSFVLTDAKIGNRALSAALANATEATYNSISVDGDTSTNDMVLVLASGVAGNRAPRGASLRVFERALTELMDDLAHQLMRDGEGVNHVVTVRVGGARSTRGARAIARSIATSPLVKTAIAGCDPNWGRILCAAGYSGAPLDPNRMSLHIGDVQVVAAGQVVADDSWERRAQKVMRQPSYDFVLDLHQGADEARFLACDLSHDYVTINADYRS